MQGKNTNVRFPFMGVGEEYAVLIYLAWVFHCAKYILNFPYLPTSKELAQQIYTIHAMH